MMSAGPRRAVVYILAIALVIAVGLFAGRLARPADPYGAVRVERVSEGASQSGAQTERVEWDTETGRGVLDVRESDGAVRRYYMEDEGGDGMRVWGGDEIQPEEMQGR